MALRTGDLVKCVRGTADVRTRERVGMAAHAGIDGLFGVELKKRNNGGPAAMSGDMCARWPVAPLTAGILRFFFPASNAFEVRIFVEPGPDIRMTGLTDHAADKRVLRLLVCAGGQAGEHYEHQRSRGRQPSVNTSACVFPMSQSCAPKYVYRSELVGYCDRADCVITVL